MQNRGENAIPEEISEEEKSVSISSKTPVGCLNESIPGSFSNVIGRSRTDSKKIAPRIPDNNLRRASVAIPIMNQEDKLIENKDDAFSTDAFLPKPPF